MTPKAEPSFQFDRGRPEPGLSFCFEYLEVRFPRNSGKCICDVNCPVAELVVHSGVCGGTLDFGNSQSIVINTERSRRI